ncbi:hypothetical protein VB711_12465 [Cronbergia sp. UHCC 0137]|uniref:hypothetical protein n=1 Tax=Cronbergia sp. UHCC 0137 TaxID=3110239 RepID=UPI002B20DF04|nr:hypothetical protein [Cronbergia sp. UHCC 0137]MEA5618644.1 hypothetical protein [Cronbergia sp. UHCC 0137]
MEHLHQLLEIENSELAKVLRFSLHGLETILDQAQQEYPQDPGIQICDEIRKEILQLLQPPPKVEINSEFKLINLRDAFNTDPELNLYLGNSSLKSQTDADLWNEIQCKLLRLPEDLATSWRQRAGEMARQIGAVENNSHLYQLPFVRDEVIYSGLQGSVTARGLCLSRPAFLNTAIGQNHPTGELNLLAGFIALYTKIIEIEPELHHAFKSVFSFDVVSLHTKPEQKYQYIEALSDRFQRTKKAEENTDLSLIVRAWLDIDEAIHSLVFVPPAERYSWWGKLQQESRRNLKKVVERAIQAGYDIRIKSLSGIYADICAFSKDDLQLDCGGTPGEVLTCLRMYARINQEEIPGRVIFRSSR